MMTDTVTLAEICQRTRWKMRLSQREFAKLIYTNQTEISFIERGFLPMDNGKIERIMEFARKCGVVRDVQ